MSAAKRPRMSGSSLLTKALESARAPVASTDEKSPCTPPSPRVVDVAPRFSAKAFRNAVPPRRVGSPKEA